MDKKLALDLVRIASVSWEERRVCEFLKKRLEENFNVIAQQVGNRFNILAAKGNSSLLFTTHMDTVPGSLEVREDDDFIYGRGSCDAKGIISSMVSACEEADSLGYSGFGMLFDVSEETDFSGIREAVSLVDPKMVIVGEPTGLKVATGQKGIIGLKIRCYGKSAPGSMPEKGDSAINRLLDILGRLRAVNLPENSALGKTNLNIGKISGGSAPNVVPDYAEAVIEIRTAVPNRSVLDLVKQQAPSPCIEIDYSYDPVLCRGDFAKSLELEETTVPYFSEAYFWSKKTPNVLIFGPGNYEFAHTEIEKVRKKDLEKASDIYLEMIKKYANRD